MDKDKCPHNVIRRGKRSPDRYPFNAYVCGSCAQIFEVKEYVEPEPSKPEPMGSESKIPWGLRNRQA